MPNRPSLDDYVDVAERIATFHEKYPDGSLQTINWEPREISGKMFIVYRAAAFRTPDDMRPGHGTAWEPFPGPTPYTKDSELMNAETAAWGRALVALGLLANRKIASKQEVKARQNAKPEPAKVATEAVATLAQHEAIAQQADECGLPPSVIANVVKLTAGSEVTLWKTEDEASEWLSKAMPRLPQRLVPKVMENLEKERAPVPS